VGGYPGLSVQPMTVLKILAVIQSQVLGASVAFALDQPQTQPLKVARREFVEGQGGGCAGDRRLGWGWSRSGALFLR
jgi:hypothetical protein